MKKTILLTVATLLATVSFAQQQLATLNHNDSITVFYGANALVQAHSAAVNGDVVTLSSGSFNPVNITKAISIRGNGMEEDPVAQTQPTIINGSMSLAVSDSAFNLSIIGVKITGQLSSDYTVYTTNPYFEKCNIAAVSPFYGGERLVNATFVNCVIHYAKTTFFSNISFINCVILNFERDWWQFADPSDRPYSTGCSLTNCIANLPSWQIRYYVYGTSTPAFACTNSILYYSYRTSDDVGTSPNTQSSYNCIGIAFYSDGDYPTNYYQSTEHQNHNYHSMSSVFKYFNGTYYDGVSFELQDSIAANILGNDGTQVGVYGGMVPFNPRVNTPRYVNCSVAPHTTLDGKLSVDIEVVSE